MSSASSETPLPRLATLEDLLAIPEAERFHEILDGELLRKEMASPKHGMGQSKLAGTLDNYNRRPNGPTRPGGWWILTEVTIEFSLHQIVQPDVAGWRRERLPELPEQFPMTLRP